MNFYDKDKVKNSLTIEQVMEVVESLGAATPRLQGEMFMCETICHNLPGDGSHKLYYWDNTKLFKCFTDCGEYFDIFQLVIKAFEIQYDEEWSMPKAVSYVAQKFGMATLQEDGFEETGLEDWTILKSYERLKTKLEGRKRVVELKEYDETILTRMAHPKIAPWLREGMTQETLDKFEISYFPLDCQIIIPHRDADGRLIGIRGRTLVKEEGELYGKYRPITAAGTMYNHPLGFSLYGLNLNKENIKLAKKVVLFEGEKSVMLYDSIFGSDNNISVACCGSSFSNHQFEILRELGVEEIILAFDRQFQEIGDKEFQRHVKHLKQIGSKYNNYLTISCLFDKDLLTGYKDSPIDCGGDVFLKLFQDRIIL